MIVPKHLENEKECTFLDNLFKLGGKNICLNTLNKNTVSDN